MLAAAPTEKTHITEEEMQIKIMNGEIDPEDVNLKVSTSSWRKQKGDTSVEEQTMADAILNGTYDPDAQGGTVRAARWRDCVRVLLPPCACACSGHCSSLPERACMCVRTSACACVLLLLRVRERRRW